MTRRAWALLIPLVLFGLWFAIVSIDRVDPPSVRAAQLTEAEAVQAGWDSAAPPRTDWTRVTLPDLWTTRWPNHDGVTWYRLHWHQRDASRPVALILDHVSLAGAIQVNGSLIGRDRNLVEPLSRHWATAQYFLLSSPLLRQGENLLVVRVSGLAKYKPGLGRIAIGAPSVLEPDFRWGNFVNFDLKLISIAAALTMSALFFLIWLLRRKEGLFGWLALAEFCASLYYYNPVAQEIWPFRTTDGWQIFVGSANLLAGATFAVFLLRYGGNSYPRTERCVAALCLGAVAIGVIAPHAVGFYVGYYHLAAVLLYYAGVFWFAGHTLRTPQLDNIILLACQSLPVAACAHDLALYFDWIEGDAYLFGISAVLALLGSCFAVAYRLVSATNRIEYFNAELQAEVAAATSELGVTLEREHQLAIAHSRAGERLRIVRDLHDGFGGTLVSAIARMEHGPAQPSGAAALAMLKEMRDDLRLVIDQTTVEHDDLAELLGPLRHRSNQLLETAGIELDWRMRGVDGLEMDGRRGLNLLRLLQEGLTNIYRHSQATRARVEITRESDQISVAIIDNGHGFAATPRDHAGAGMASMRERASILGGTLQVHSSPKGTRLQIVFPARRQEDRPGGDPH